MVNSDWWHEHTLIWWILAEDPAEVHVEHMASLRHHQIFQVSIADCDQVRRHSIACTRVFIGLMYLFLLFSISA